MSESTSFQKRQTTLSVAAVIFAMIIAQAVSEALQNAGQPFWLRMLIIGLVGGVLAGGFYVVADRIWRKRSKAIDHGGPRE